MKKRGKQSKRFLSSTLSALVILTVVMPNNSYSTVLAEEFDKDSNKVTIKNLEKASRDETYFKYENPYEVVRVIVELEEPAAIEKAKADGEKRPSKESVQEVKENQKDIKKDAEEITGEEVNQSFGTLINGFSIDTKVKDIEELKKLDGVKSVKVVKKYYPAMTSAKELTQAKNVWSDLGLKGEGMVVSIIDSGIDPTHKDMKISDSSKAKLREENLKEGPGKYYTEKVPYGYNFADDNDNIIDTHPRVSMHGMHVAGIVAANGSDEEVDKNEAIKGVAPEAQLLAMKVFSNNPNRNGASEDDIVAAIEESVNQGADIINMSLGSSAGFQQEDDPEQIAVKKAVDAGVVVVVAAGNSQYSTAPYKVPDIKDTGLVGAPGTAKDALTVANYQNNKMPLPSIKVTSDGKEYNVPFMESDEKNNVDTSKEYEIVDCGLGFEEDFYKKDLKGKVALIKRGKLSFVEKIMNAQSAGAVGVIIYNSDGQDGFINMATSPMVKIPSVFIKNSDGKRLVESLNNGVKINFTNNKMLVESSEAGDFVESSSWGPTPSLDFKPQISAPGGNIYSTLNDNKYGIKTGTSMAAPHVAGGEALIVEGLKKENPNLKGRDLVELAKNTSISTSKIMMDKHNKDIPYSPRRQGAGVIQIEEALKNKVVVTDEQNNPTVALKQIGNEKEFTLRLKNYDNKPVEYKVENLGGVLTETSEKLNTISHDVKLEGAQVTFDKNNIVVPANGEERLKVKLTIPKAVSAERFVEGFIKFTSEDKPSLSVPFIGYYGDWGKEQIIEAMNWDKEKQKFIVPSGILTNLNGKLGYRLGLSGTDVDGNLQIDPDKIAISPNDDGNGDIIAPYLYYLRNSRVTEVELLDENKKSLGVIGHENYIRKEEYSEPSGSGKSPNLFENLNWDGKVYNSATGEKEAVKEGQYYLNIKSKVDYDNAKYQDLIVPVKVDVTSPTIELLSEEKVLTKDNSSEVDYKLQWQASDNVALIPGIVNININGKDVQANVEEIDGIYSCDVKLKANSVNNIKVAMNDTAFNLAEASKSVKVESSESIITFEDGFEKSTLEVNDGKEYVVRGVALGSIKEFKLNGEEVKVNEDGTFAHKINLNEGFNKINIYVKDDKGNELYNYATKVFCDVTAPNINLESPKIEEDGIVITNQDKILVKGTVEDNTLGYKFYKNDVMEIEVVNRSDIGNDNTRKEFSYEIPAKDGEVISLKAVDLSGHETIKKFKVNVDKNLPKIVIDGVTEDGVYNKDVLPKVTADKDVKITYLLDGEDYDGKSPISEEGKHNLKINVADKAGNKVDEEVNFEIDKTPVSILFANLENNKLYNKEVRPEINTGGEEAVIKYILNGKYYDGQTPIKEEGNHNLKVVAIDKAGNTSQSEVNFGIDRTPVEFFVSGVEDGKVYNEPVTPIIDVDDKDADVNYTLNGEKYDGNSRIDKDGEHNLVLTAIDKAGNRSEKNINFKIDRSKPKESDPKEENNDKYNEPVEMVVNKPEPLSDTKEEIEANNSENPKVEELKTEENEKQVSKEKKLSLPNTGQVIGSSVLGLLGVAIASLGIKLSRRKKKDN
ncbi:S8 family serine peptidase [Clostridium sp. B9]|uniref:S8 family serine peptidase n=1 Tax=Clostridium sp. B9 TaxID=3423224 RepID=UPI003D2EEB43